MTEPNRVLPETQTHADVILDASREVADYLVACYDAGIREIPSDELYEAFADKIPMRDMESILFMLYWSHILRHDWEYMVGSIVVLTERVELLEAK
jgi:hypothetical protein